MNSTSSCPGCGKYIRDDAPEGLCSACLLTFAVRGFPDDASSSSTGTATPKARRAANAWRFGDYELLEEIARGGMGVVFKARQLSLNRIVAVKMIRAGHFASDAEIRRFHTEAEAAAHLRHPNIVAIHETGERDGQHFFSMDYIEGRNLAEVARRRLWSPLKAACCLRTIAEAIQYAHQRGVLHRDLKPSNVIVNAEGEPHVTDFGLAKILQQPSDATVTGALLGSPSYMPPEQAGGGRGDVSVRSDVYALGAMLYELLTGRAPFQAASAAETLRNVLESEPVPPRALNASLPRDLETICLKALQKDPENRYASAQDLAEDLGRFLREEPIQARPVSDAEKFWRWCRRNPALSGSLALCFLLLVAIALGASTAAWRIGQESHRATEAERDAKHKLWAAYLAQARATRHSGVAGRRAAGVAAVTAAARLRPAIELRNEAVACLALPDLWIDHKWPGYPEGSTAIAFDRSVERYARADKHGTISVRDVATDGELTQLQSRGAPVVHLVFSPDQRHLLARYGHAGAEAVVRIWDLADANVTLELAASGGERAVAFTPDGSRLAMADHSGTIRVVRVAGGEPERAFSAGMPPVELHFDHAGERLAGFSGAIVEVFEMAGTGRALRLTNATAVTSLSWDPDGNHLAVGCHDERIHLWRFLPQVSVRAFSEDESSAVELAFTHSGWQLVSANDDGGLQIRDATTGRVLVHHPAAGFSRLHFDPQDSKLAFTLTPPEVTVWRYADGAECRVLPAPQFSQAIAFSPDGRVLACGTKNGIWLYDTKQVGIMATPLGAVGKLAFGAVEALFFTPDQTALITLGVSGLLRWPLAQEKAPPSVILRVGPPETLLTNDLAGEPSGALSGDGKTIAVVGNTGTRVGQLQTGSASWTSLHLPSGSVALSRHGRWLATGADGSGEARVWDLGHTNLVGSWPVNTASVIFSPKDRWLVVSTDTELSLYETVDWRLHQRFERDRGESLPGPVAVSSDETLLAFARSARNVELLNPETGESLATLEAPEPSVIRALCFTLDGTHLAALTRGQKVQLWDLRLLRRELAELGLDWSAPPYPAATNLLIAPLVFDLRREAGPGSR